MRRLLRFTARRAALLAWLAWQALPGQASAADTKAAEPASVIDRLPLSDAIVHRQGTGRRRIAVFADPNCPYCRKLESDLAGLPDVTVYTFLVPVLAASSRERSRNVWCAPDPARAWHDWMVRSVPAPRSAEGCDHGTLERNLQLARRVGLAGTPGLLFDSGRWIMGALEPRTLDLTLTIESVAPAQRSASPR